MLIVTYNIQFGRGRDGRIDLDRTAAAIRDADVIALQEVERNWRPQAHADQAARLAELLPQHRWVYGATYDLDASSVDATGRVQNKRRQLGTMILSRWPITSTRTYPLPMAPTSGQVDGPSLALEAVVQDGRRALRLYNVHLSHLSRRQRMMQVEALQRAIAQSTLGGGVITGPNVDFPGLPDDWMVMPPGPLPAMPDAIVVLGDFNMTPDSPEYDALAGPRDPIYGRLHEVDRFADALTLAGFPETSGVTYPAKDREPAMRIDHIMVSAPLFDRVRRGWIDNDADASDHQPVWAELDF